MTPLAQAARFVGRDPSAAIVSALGFLARGGILLPLALIVEIPSPITVTQIFGIDAITATGEPTRALVLTIATAVAIAVVAVLALIAVAAWSDSVLFARVRGVGPARPAEVAGLAWLQSLGILPGLVGFVLAVPIVRDVVVDELLLPSQLDVPFLLRVLRGAEAPLIRAVVLIAVFELLVTVATRVYLGDPARRSAGRAYLGGLAEIARGPGRVIVAWLIGWAVLLGAVAVALGAVALAWSGVRAGFLSPDALSSLQSIGRALGAGTLFAAVWVAAILLIGLASAFRSALWTCSFRRTSMAGPTPAEFATSQ